ncbi:t-SNARE [Komagataella phaffii CBS 7435]|uniref:t-SNARE protein important for fusion of secretory vesicles with the plasma membrane n=2 Tax=Komagataella phaffii TaxID=460519 RepID=C4R2R9_KOMPG|nr:t-SNARE protein important for fusion of secretory vesicles with the plasma membrane [Komagataella phaffii GS115]AOA62710.1 GQ67_01213T0 [Komagataella phaffii]CAH2447651.1 t-SNARE [Komagataella phaffii CBS 7435]AOA67327.1 GQ68_00176T0 [Komagataella phaffii GS115]CAY69793.1 t-SNARE protein important for fusion of secretory vesicles with the plasma membrane [Komagataella phaffii GS115]CCA37836.1 t-SNARE [Komagataella phaffii CBS 7435]
MGLKKLLKLQPPSQEEIEKQNRENLQAQGVSIRSEKKRPDKFAAFKQYAQDKVTQSPTYRPVSKESVQANYQPYQSDRKLKKAQEEKISASNSNNPYAQYSDSYGAQSGTNGSSISNLNSQEYSSGRINNPYSSYENSENVAALEQEEELSFGGANDAGPQQLRRLQTNQTAQTNGFSQFGDLNDLPESVLNAPVSSQAHEQSLMTPEEIEEEEEVEAIKQDIKFTKQQSVGSTRNTLRMAQEAEQSGQNTLGVLGSQSERLYNVERTLALADTQNKIADDKVKELKKVNRSIFAVHAGNPFNSKRRLRRQEEDIKNRRMEEKLISEQLRSQVYRSEHRITSSLREQNAKSELQEKYDKERKLKEAQRYQFENDSEDDDMELEIASNLDQIGNATSRLKKLAVTASEEIDHQNKRLKNIEEDADRLDINVHLNQHRIQHIR